MGAAAVLVDGVASDRVAATDRGLAFGDGVFRTVAVRSSRPLNWTWHYRRLAADCALLRLELPQERVLLDEIAAVAPADAVAKVIVTRGTSARGYSIPEKARCVRIVAAFPQPARGNDGEGGVRVRRCDLVLSQQPRLAGAKTLNRLENVLARSEWDDAAIAEGLIADARGRVIEGTMTNIFAVRAGRVATPDLSRCGVVGAQRERVREMLAAVEVVDLDWRAIESADELFLTNSLIGAWPVTALGERTWPVGPVARRVQSMLAEADARA
ncbi:MAG: aminodeoxychorismate lyase [Usitatibacter sp.]